MKNVLLIFGAVLLLTACKPKKSSLDIDKNMVMTDTTGAYNANGSGDTGARARYNNAAMANKTGSQGSSNTNAANNNANQSNNNSTANNPAANNNGTNAAPQDKGWSKAAKGATIGAGGGAVLGAIVSKDKGKGAVIGAVLGAGTGYVIGRSKDKKSGRVARKRAQRRAAKQ